MTARPALSPSSARVLAAIEAFWAQHGYSPSLRDLVRPSGLNSTAPVAYQLERLRELGYITFDDRIARSIVIVKGDK